MYGERRPRRGINALEGAGMLACLAVVGVVSVLLYLVYRLTLRKVCAVTIDRPGHENAPSLTGRVRDGGSLGQWFWDWAQAGFSASKARQCFFRASFWRVSQASNSRAWGFPA